MRRVIVFGFLATFVSSFGQTFFLGLFSPQFQAAAGIGSTRVSLLYGVATLASGSLLFWLGGAMDRLPLRRAIAITLLLFVTGSLLAAGVQGSLVSSGGDDGMPCAACETYVKPLKDGSFAVGGCLFHRLQDVLTR